MSVVILITFQDVGWSFPDRLWAIEARRVLVTAAIKSCVLAPKLRLLCLITNCQNPGSAKIKINKKICAQKSPKPPPNYYKIAKIPDFFSATPAIFENFS